MSWIVRHPNYPADIAHPQRIVTDFAVAECILRHDQRFASSPFIVIAVLVSNLY